MTNRELGKAVRKAIKDELGANARQVSVRISDTGWSQVIDVRRKDLSVDLFALRALVESFSKTRTDDFGNILQGLNIYTHVS